MDYPKYNHYLIFNRIGRDRYRIKDLLTEEEWEVSAFYARFLKSLDGKTDPYDIYSNQISEEEVDWILEDMEDEGFLEDIRKVIPLGVGSILIPLWIPKIGKVHRIIGVLWNKILMLSWLPLLVIGLYVYLNYNWEVVEKSYGIVKGYFWGLVPGVLLHELSHAFVCIGYSSKNHFFEMGVMTHYFLPGAYVTIDYSEMKNRFKRAQINAAGIECNIALCGLFFYCLKFGAFDSLALIIAAFINLMLALFNTTLVAGIDGMRIFREIFANSDDFVERAKMLVWDRKSKKMLHQKGINGKATIAACYIIVVMQVLLVQSVYFLYR